MSSAADRGEDVRPPMARAVRRPAGREIGVPFAATSRWLRGRIIERLRAAGDEWVTMGEPIGTHDLTAVTTALVVLADEGLVELDGLEADAAAGRRARLPLR
jgi:hypothetical protein